VDSSAAPRDAAGHADSSNHRDASHHADSATADSGHTLDAGREGGLADTGLGDALTRDSALDGQDASAEGGRDAGEGIGPHGGTLDTLTFAVVGDSRPPNIDDVAGYPTAVVTKIWQDVEAATPRPAFGISTGDYMFANPATMPGTQAAQLQAYKTAQSVFTNLVFPTMGNQECDGNTGDNCDTCGNACTTIGGACVAGTCQTPNFATFLSVLLAPVAETLPYYVVNIDGPASAWSAKFVFVACNAWNATQATWLGTELAVATTYTFVVRHEGTVATTAPCLSGTGSMNADTIMAGYPYTLLIAGHTHTYAYYASEKQVVVGNGGAPLTGSIDYGYVIARQQGNGSIVFTEYDYSTNAVQSSFTVQ
jgi:hypothetical protein